MKDKQMTMKESLYLLYAYISISGFLLVVVSKITKNLERVLDFNPIVSLAIVLNIVVFTSLYYYKKKHSTHVNHNNF